MTSHESLVSFGSVSFWLLIALVLFGSVVGNLRSIAMSTAVTLLVPEDQRDRANGLVGTVLGVSFTITSVLSGLAVGQLGMGWALIFSVALTLVAVIHLLTIRFPEPAVERADDAPHEPMFDFRGALDAISGVSGLYGLIFFAAFNNLLGGVFMSLLDAYGLSLMSVEAWGMLFAVISFGFIGGGLVVAKRGLGRRPMRVILICNAVNWTICSVFTLQSSIPLLFVGMLVWMSLMPAIEAAEQTVLQQVVPYEKQGRVFGFAQTVESAASPFTALLIGPIAQFAAIPFMTDGRGADLIGGWFGTGDERGLALIFTIAGILGVIATIAAARSRWYHQLSARTDSAAPDVESDPGRATELVDRVLCPGNLSGGQMAAASRRAAMSSHVKPASNSTSSVCWPSSGAISPVRAGGVAEPHGRGHHRVAVGGAGEIAVRPDVRVGDDGGVVADRSVADAVLGEQLAPVRRGPRGERVGEFGEHRPFGVAEVQRLGEPLDEIGTSDQVVEPGAVRPGDADDRDPAVGGREHPVHAGDQRVPVVRPARRLAGEQRRRDLRRLRPDLSAEQRHVDPLPTPGPLPGEEGGADSTDQVEAGDVIADRDGDRAVRITVGADRADQPAGGLRAEIGALPAGVGSLGAEARAGGVDDARVALGDLFVRQTPLVERAGLEVGDEHVGLLGQPEERVAAFGLAQVDGDAPLPSVAGDEVRRHEVGRRRREPPALVAEAR